MTSTVQAHPVQVTTDTEKDTDTEKVAMEDATTDRTTDLITKIKAFLLKFTCACTDEEPTTQVFIDESKFCFNEKSLNNEKFGFSKTFLFFH